MMSDRNPTIFVTGATGQLGRRVISQLLTRTPAASIVAGVRSLDNGLARDFEARGVEVRTIDYSLPETLVSAFKDVDRILLISSSSMTDRVGQHGNVIEAARQEGVELIAYTSLLHADTSVLGMADDHLRTEDLLNASGLPFVLLRHGWYTENHMESVPTAIKYGAVLGAAGGGRFSTATRQDFAEAAATVLTSENQAGLTYELAGDDAYTLGDLAGAIADATGREIVYRDMPEGEFRDTLRKLGLPEPLAELIANADAAAAKGALEDHSHQLSDLIGRPTTPLDVTLAETLREIGKGKAQG